MSLRQAAMSAWAWLDERLALERLWTALFARRIPDAGGPVAWLYVLGSATLFVFALQAFSGTLLALGYVPSPEQAYDSVQYLNERALLGRFVRGLHHWGATFMVVLAALHMGRVGFMGAYKYPREATWLTGVGLFLIVLLFGFTGYLLPWDQKAYWATAVGANIAAQTPVVGPAIARILLGADEMGAATLTRFYAVHVLVLPIATLALLGAHLFLVVWHGISEPPARKASGGPPATDWHEEYRRRYSRFKEAGKPFFPHAALKDAVFAAVLFAALSWLAVEFGAELEPLADPTDTTYNPRPEWYFLFVFQALKFFPGSLEAVAANLLPGAALGLLALLPFLDRGPERHPLDRPLVTGLGVLAILGWGWLTWAGWKSPLTNPVVENDPKVSAGLRLYRDLKCAYCHSIAGQGGRLGPALDRAAADEDEDWLERHLREPKALVPGSRMPKLNLLDEEIDVLAAYIKSLGAGGPYTDEAPRLFAEDCSACHRLGKEGGEIGPDLSLIGSAREKSFLRRYIEDPSKLNSSSTMPGYRGQLTDEQIEDLARYLSSQGR